MTLRKIKNLKYDWKFKKADIAGAESINFVDKSWENVRVPHDWAISGPFERENDMQFCKIDWDGEKEAYEHNGRTGGLPHMGVGWYRRKFEVSKKAAGKKIWLEFDGVMSRSSVYVNGQYAGGRPYGYSSFKLDVTELVELGSSDNILAVKVDNPSFSSRWYPGAGIYRNVRLVVLDPIHVAHWGTYVTTPVIEENYAEVNIKTKLENDGSNASVELKTSIVSPDGAVIAVEQLEKKFKGEVEIEQSFSIDNPKLWGLENPQMYKVQSELSVEGERRDFYETPFGIRSIEFSNDKGMLLNGERVYMKGVCMHHDLGPLGAALNYRALERQMEIMKEMGCNSIRTSHNPPAPELLEICDRMGLLVIDEAYDEWKMMKLERSIGEFFDEWSERDLTDMIIRDRNHPCVFMWSLGNEILEQGVPDGAKVAQYLHDIAKRVDPTRPTTAGFNMPDGSLEHGMAGVVDLAGWNYCPNRYSEFHSKNPDLISYGSETMSTVSSRGIYHFPVREERLGDSDACHADLQLSSYDLVVPPWATTMETEFHALDNCPYIFGQYVWTGFDYIGEPTPYNRQWPARSSYFGIVDLGGLPKDRYYMFQTQWTDKDILHILPHWTWHGREGLRTPVHIYSSFEEVELFLNGRSLGKRKLQTKSFNLLNHYRFIWDNVFYEAGELKAVAYSDGKPAMEKIIKTAGLAEKLTLEVDRNEFSADGDDMVFVTVAVEDRNGNPNPIACNLVEFELDGPAEIAGVCNGDPTCLDSFKDDKCKLFSGKCVVYLQSVKDCKGEVKLKAAGAGVKSAEITLKVK